MSYEALGDCEDQRNYQQNGSDDHHSRKAMRSSSSSVVSSSSGTSFRLRQRPPEPLAEPLTGDLENGDAAEDPFFVFRGDLFQKLDLVDESLAEFLRVVNQTVRTVQHRSSTLTGALSS
jgi:hypothetical protein